MALTGRAKRKIKTVAGKLKKLQRHTQVSLKH